MSRPTGIAQPSGAPAAPGRMRSSMRSAAGRKICSSPRRPSTGWHLARQSSPLFWRTRIFSTGTARRLSPGRGDPLCRGHRRFNLPAEERAPLYTNFTTVLVGSCDTPLPYGAGPAPYTAQNCSIRVTSRSAMEAVTGSENFTLDDRTILIYADPESGAALTAKLLTLLDGEGFYRYAIADCTPARNGRSGGSRSRCCWASFLAAFSCWCSPSAPPGSSARWAAL